MSTDTVERVLGRSAVRFEAWAREHARRWNGDVLPAEGMPGAVGEVRGVP